MTDKDPYSDIIIGKCPSTGQFCDGLRDLRFISDASSHAFGMAVGNGSFSAMTVGQQAAFDRNMEEGNRIGELSRMAVAGPCMGACALAEIDIATYVKGGPSA